MSEWVNIKLGDILEIIRNGSSNIQIQKFTNYPVTRIETISYCKIDFLKVGFVEKIDEKYKLKYGDLLLSNINSLKHIGKIAFYDSKKTLYHGMNLLLLRFYSNYSSKFIYYLLVFKKNWFEKNACQAVNQASINQATIKKFEIYIPKSKTEQDKIADILSTIDAAIEKTEAIIKKYERIKTGLMQDLLTKGIDEHGNIRSEQTHEFKDSPLGRIPKEWENLKMKNICSVSQGLQIAIEKRFSEYSTNRFLYITLQFLKEPDRYLYYIENPPINVIFNKEDILFTRTGNTGQIITDITGVYHNNFFKIDYNKNMILKNYLVFFLNWEVIQNLIKDLAGTTTIPDLKHNDFYSLPILFPKCLKEQMRIINFLNTNSKIINYNKGMLEKLQKLKTGLMQDLLTGHVPVDSLLKENG